MLLTTPLTTFLNANLTPQLHTLLLLTPSGKLLSSASPHPASLLRAQATIASSIWSQYDPIALSNTFSAALPTSRSQAQSQTPTQTRDGNNLKSILIQLENSTMIIKSLSCSLLFVAIGPSPSTSISTSAHALGTQLSYLALSSAAATPPPDQVFHPNLGSSPPSQSRSQIQPGAYSGQHLSVEGYGDGTHGREGNNGITSSAASDNGDYAGSGRSSNVGGVGSLRLLRRQAEELAKWLDGELEGFVMPGPL